MWNHYLGKRRVNFTVAADTSSTSEQAIDVYDNTKLIGVISERGRVMKYVYLCVNVEPVYMSSFIEKIFSSKVDAFEYQCERGGDKFIRIQTWEVSTYDKD
jgi:hypothetical protein